jgi:addiction module HigA family antidote
LCGRKLDQLNAATSRESLRLPPGNRWEKLTDDRQGQDAIRINAQVRGASHSDKPAEWIGASYPRINELIHGKRGITVDTALRLEQAFGMEAQFWLNLQLAWDLYQARHSRFAREIARIKRHPAIGA